MRPLPPSAWTLADARELPEGQDYAGSGLDWEPGTLLHAYASGYFPMPRDLESDAIDWWSPDPRAVFDPKRIRVTRSLRSSLGRFRITLNQSFDDVISACADPARSSRWIDSNVHHAYGELHRLGWAHSIEVWDGEHLVGGLYGVEIGGLFAGESMFHRAPDASKVALVSLAWLLREGNRRIDSQWMTPHLASLGAIAMPRRQYLDELPAFLAEREVLHGLPMGTVITPRVQP